MTGMAMDLGFGRIIVSCCSTWAAEEVEGSVCLKSCVFLKDCVGTLTFQEQADVESAPHCCLQVQPYVSATCNYNCLDACGFTETRFCRI